MTRITNEQLIAFAAHELEGPEAEAVAAHLAEHPGAARTVELYRTAAARTRADDTVAVPAETAARAKAIFQAAGAEAPRGLTEHLRVVVARLIYDSRRQPAAVRFSGGGNRIQLSFEAGNREIDLQATRIAPGPSSPAGAPDRWQFVGQVASDEDPEAVMVTVLTPGTDAAPAIRSDDRALFTLEVASGTHELHIAIDDEVLVLRDIEIG